MKLLMISSDQKIFEDNSPVRQRMEAFSSSVDMLHILVIARRHTTEAPVVSGKKMVIYPITINFWAFKKIFLALREAREIVQADITGRWVVTAQDPFFMGLFGWLIARKKIPLELQVHTDIGSPFFVTESIMNRIKLSLARFLLPRASLVRVVSVRVKNALLRDFKVSEDRIVVLPVYVDPNRSAFPQDETMKKPYPITILMMSRLTPEKDFITALRAFKIVAQKNPDAGLLIVGDGPDKNLIQRKVNDFSLFRKVTFYPWSSAIGTYFKHADIFLLTSRYEGYGMTLIESGMARCPIVTTDVGIVGELIQDRQSALVCRVGDHRSLARALQELIDEPSLREALRSHFRESLTRHLPANQDMYLAQYKLALQRLFSVTL